MAEIKPYYEDEWVTIYHLHNAPVYGIISLDDCSEVRSWGNEKGINKHRNISTGESGLGQTIMPIKVMISLLNLGELELYAVIKSNLAKDAVIRKLRDTIRMTMREIITQRISASYAEDAICLRVVD